MSRRGESSSPVTDELMSEAFAAMQADSEHIRDASTTSSRRERLLPALLVHVELERSALSRRRRWRIASGVALAASVCLGVGFGANWFSEPRASLAELTLTEFTGSYEITKPDGQRLPSTNGPASLTVGSRLSVAADSAAKLNTPNGVTAALAQGSALEVLQLDPFSYESLRLVQGRVDVKVPPLEPGRRFAVVTAQATVIVHGTDFTVDLQGGDADGRPCVQVREGLVEVRTPEKAEWLGANSNWSCAEPLNPGEPHPEQQVERPGITPSLLPASPKLVVRPKAEGPGDTLALQNRLFRSGLQNKQKENWDLAERQLTELLRVYPNSPFADEARLQLAEIQLRTK